MGLCAMYFLVYLDMPLIVTVHIYHTVCVTVWIMGVWAHAPTVMTPGLLAGRTDLHKGGRTLRSLP